ncbi:8-oxo-dGTP pyrophosphatase MutT (NUDIX family) [Cytobacillus eiseniae]|uniref:8-oxo-dGTP pyrophosphatase MutT (NUDIX family) n=1 Tax=Cytobacillus eiseniae TaxID=762947 RepID=A0ABS4RH32_9BACI|nr:CoA pyrophosphatase [Cytobacillus eiseniae]MBP2242193.1 8-oxo-dGTP pyrophosphatase MutT (NUDIX family) [Cytobacillus eiseniae]
MQLDEIMKRLHTRKPTILGNENFSKFAILLPLLFVKDELHILFEVRSQQLRRQPGEICFPGGRMDRSDRDEKYTAIRETCEELGISENRITNVYPLDYMISPFGQIIYPFVGFIDSIDEMKPNPDEVDHIFTVPLSFLKMNKPEIFQVHFKAEPEKDFPLNQIPGGEKYNWQARKMDECFYYYEDKVIWGLTARILTHFLEII